MKKVRFTRYDTKYDIAKLGCQALFSPQHFIETKLNFDLWCEDIEQ